MTQTGRKSDDEIWYLAYGSNMSPKVMRDRGISPLDMVTVVVPDYVLTFDLFGTPYKEPSFASIARVTRVQHLPKDIGASKEQNDFANNNLSSTVHDQRYVPFVHGVAYCISLTDYGILLRSEGAGTLYQEIAIDAVILERETFQQIRTPGSEQQKHHLSLKLQGQKLVVRTLQAKYPRRPHGSPSARYKVREDEQVCSRCSKKICVNQIVNDLRVQALLVTGMNEHRLPNEYCEYIRSLPVYVPRTNDIGAQVFLKFWRPWLLLMIRLVHSTSKDNRGCPNWMSLLLFIFYKITWGLHDIVFSRIFGKGDGSRISYPGIQFV